MLLSYGALAGSGDTSQPSGPASVRLHGAGDKETPVLAPHIPEPPSPSPCSPGPCSVVTVVVVMVEVVVVPSSSPETPVTPKVGTRLGAAELDPDPPVGGCEGSVPGATPQGSPHGPERPAGVVSGAVGKATLGKAGARGRIWGAGGPGSGLKASSGSTGPGRPGGKGAWAR